MIASGVGFTLDLLDKVSLQVTIGNISFKKLSEIYNTELSLYSTDMILNSDLLEDNWILFRLISEIIILKWERKAENSHYHTEKICQEVYPKFEHIVDNRWINHACSEIGFENRIIVCDGNGKLYRCCCASLIERVQQESGNANYVNGCINDPKRGNQHVIY